MRRFGLAVLGVLAVALALRVTYVLTVTRHDTDVYDQTYYELQARTVADGNGFDDPFVLLRDPTRHTPAADHPPLTVLAVVPAAFIGDVDSRTLAMKLTMAALGTAAVAVIALLGREVGGAAVGLLAGGVAAVDPNLWMNDGLVMSETPATLLTAAVLLVAWRVAHRRLSWRLVVALGALTGLATLARAELGLLAPLAVLPALWRGAGPDRARFVRATAGAALSTLVVLGPWLVYNASRFQDPVLISTGDGIALAAGSCDSAYYGHLIGWADVFGCTDPGSGLEQSVWNGRNRTRGIDYIGDHLGRLPLVALARLGRAWDVYAPNQTFRFNSSEGRPLVASWLGAVVGWVLAALAVGGAVIVHRRRQLLAILLAPIVIACITVALLSAGLPRYRAPAEPSLIVLAMVAAVALAQRLQSRRGSTGASRPVPVDELDEAPLTSSW